MAGAPAPYGATIMEHFRRPRNQGPLPGADVAREGANPLCGDRVRVELTVRDGVVADPAPVRWADVGSTRRLRRRREEAELDLRPLWSSFGLPFLAGAPLPGIVWASCYPTTNATIFHLRSPPQFRTMRSGVVG